jgi:hypothetical protein
MEGMSSGGVASDWYRALYSNPPRNLRLTHTKKSAPYTADMAEWLD